MVAGNFSKADQGYVLMTPRLPRAVKASEVTLSKDMTIEQAFQRIVANCLMQLQANEACLLQTDSQIYDAEALHQMRVALRRMRSAFALFDQLLQLPPDLQQEFDWLSAQLGDARDWDVLLGSTISKLSPVAEQAIDLAEMKQAIQEKVDHLHDAVSGAVSSQRYMSLTLRLNRWLQGCGWRDSMSSTERDYLAGSVKRFATKTLRHEQRRLSWRGRTLHTANPSALHRVRIAAKKRVMLPNFFNRYFHPKQFALIFDHSLPCRIN